MNNLTVSAGEAARRLGVAPITIQRWVDSGLLNAERTPGGHRRIYVTELRRLIAESRPKELSGPLADWLNVLRAGDPVRVKSAMLTAKKRHGGWAGVADEIVSAIAELGRDWEAGRCHIFEEHAATETLRRGVGLCTAEMRFASSAPRAVLFAVEGERHTLGLLLAELVLADEGWRCVSLGEALPSDELQPLVEKISPDLLVVSASSCVPGKVVERYQAELKHITERNDIGLALAGSGAWVADPTIHRLVTFEDLRALLTKWDQSA
ncbi:MAG TPA: MerR family DNA-binding transcriptional regulator [Sedimentisphaerales bacterium]|nr:MerR family DNA-binding transcriptional regulator [Sedimentisphaerales bacterium]